MSPSPTLISFINTKGFRKVPNNANQVGNNQFAHQLFMVFQETQNLIYLAYAREGNYLKQRRLERTWCYQLGSKFLADSHHLIAVSLVLSFAGTNSDLLLVSETQVLNHKTKTNKDLLSEFATITSIRLLPLEG